MRSSYLEVTYRHGRVFAAYYHVTARAGRRTARTRRVARGMLVDYARDGEPLGVEITAPSVVTLAALNRVLRQLDLDPLKADEFAPLRVAS
ncbi:MAG TPA: hypothetical protein VFY71_13875 [Planctomycetota bacterium]|nr:hypothetical protein [Planctomycetota bacterium]